MKLLHVADLHGGLVTHSRPDPDTGLPSRLLDVARCWHRAAEIGVEQGVDLAIVAGDTFHQPNPDAASLTLFAHGLRVLEEEGIPTIIIAGNHDRAPHPNRSSVLQVFDDGRDLVWIVERPEVVEVAGVRVACLPSVSRHQLMARRPGLARSEADQVLGDGLVSILGDLRVQGADVLTAHWPVQGAILGNEKDIAILPEPVIPFAELQGPWGYVALGHIHKAQPVGGAEGIAPLGWYAGSIDRMNFGEEHEPKLALVVELNGAVAAVEQHELPARRFVTLDDLAVEDQEFDLEGAIVRLRLSADHAGHVDAIRSELYSAGADVVIGGAEVPREVRSRAEHVTESLGPEDALEAWFDVKGIDEADRPDLRDAAKELAAEAEA